MRAHGALFALAIGVDLKILDRATLSCRIHRQRAPGTPTNLVPSFSRRLGRSASATSRQSLRLCVNCSGSSN